MCAHDLQVDWRDTRNETEGVGERQQDREQQDTLAEKLQDVLLRGLELADKAVVAYGDGALSMRLLITSYIGTCHAVGEKVPHVCEQIGCPRCSVIACIYIEYADTASVLEENKQRRVP